MRWIIDANLQTTAHITPRLLSMERTIYSPVSPQRRTSSLGLSTGKDVAVGDPGTMELFTVCNLTFCKLKHQLYANVISFVNTDSMVNPNRLHGI